MKKLKTFELNRKTVDEYKEADKVPIIIILDNVRSLSNVGSAFRTCDAFLIEGICLCGITAQPPHREIQKTALGATDSVDWKYYQNVEDAIKELKSKGYHIIGVEQTDKSILLNEFGVKKDQKYALVFGHEVNGVSDEALSLIDDCIEIPQYGTKHSFNVSVSLGIVLWEFVRS